MPFNSPNPNEKPQGGALKSLVQAERLVQIALVLPIAVLIGWFFGSMLDRWFHQHWITFVGLVFGIIAGMLEAVRMALAAGQHRKSRAEKTGGGER
jgi:F0F1-type ATP synthase assembly protein I